MRLFTLSPRLAECAGLVRVGARLADVGADHAKLPVWLARQGLIESAVACDVSPGSLASANRNITLHRAGHMVKTRLSDGLSEIDPDEADDIVIAGMGGELIAEILSGADWIKNPRYNLILQPMSRPERLRRWLLESGFEIISEKAVPDAGRLYVVIQACFCSPAN